MLLIFCDFLNKKVIYVFTQYIIYGGYFISTTIFNRKDFFMNYYKKIKNTLIKNEAYKKVKDYSKNRSDLNSYF